MTRKQAFTVMGKLALEVNLEILAGSFDEAIKLSHELVVADFVTIKGGYIDGELSIEGVFRG